MTKEQQESYENAKICYICKEKFESKYIKDKKYCKHCAPHSTCNSKYSIPKKIPMAFHNRSNYDYRFIIKELAEEF